MKKVKFLSVIFALIFANIANAQEWFPDSETNEKGEDVFLLSYAYKNNSTPKAIFFYEAGIIDLFIPTPKPIETDENHAIANEVPVVIDFFFNGEKLNPEQSVPFYGYTTDNNKAILIRDTYGIIATMFAMARTYNDTIKCSMIVHVPQYDGTTYSVILISDYMSNLWLDKVLKLYRLQNN